MPSSASFIVAARYQADIWVAKEDLEVNGKSIMGMMMLAAEPVSAFVQKHPTVKMLALSFLILIGFALVAESFHQKIPKGYIYFAMAFAVVVEMLNRGVAPHGGKAGARRRSLGFARRLPGKLFHHFLQPQSSLF